MKKLSLILIGLMACFAIGVSTAQAQTYSLTDLGVVKDMVASEPTAINSQGHVTGTSYAGSESCAFHFFKALMQDAGGVNSRGFGINSANTIVGDAYFSGPPGRIINPSHAAIFKSGGVTDLGALEGQIYSRATGINAIGWVVGFSGPTRDSSLSRPFIWSRGTGMIDFGTLGGPYAQAYAINDAGFVTGTSLTHALEGDYHAFIYQPLSITERFTEPMRDLGALGGAAAFSCGMAVNSSNHVAGYSRINLFDDRVHAFFHNGSKMLDLGSLGGSTFYTDSSVALGLNNWDQVVGYSYLSLGNVGIKQVAFLWSRNSKGVGEMKNLNELIGGAARSYSLFSATAINDNGQIAASAYYKGGVHAVLLTPMVGPIKWPPPSP
jgi:probable HAF family extracellular repeat protein